jgi:hypothetical protein
MTTAKSTWAALLPIALVGSCSLDTATLYLCLRDQFRRSRRKRRLP